MLKYFKRLWGKSMGLFKNRNILRISPDDTHDGYIVDKIVEGENVSIEIEKGLDGNEKLVISANATQEILSLNKDSKIHKNVHLVIADASKNHVILTLPSAKHHHGQLSIVCEDAAHGIEIAPDEADVIFDNSNSTFHARGDALTLISGGSTWYIVGRYASQWYA